MIDLHHHCLPGVDDGPAELSAAVEMCRMSEAEGIETIVVTPHVLRGRWPVFSPGELAARLERLREATGDRPRLMLGSEYFFAHDMAEVLRAGSAIIPLAGSRYVLLELAANNLPPLLDQPLYRAQLDGWVPVIAHPERNLVFQNHPDALRNLVQLGTRTQVTAGSLTGEFGREARKAAELFLRRNLVHFVATDAHNVGKRAPRVREAAAALESIVGTETADALLRENPRAVSENRPLPWEPEPLESRSDGLFTRFRSFFGPRTP